jgi:hypothetical protein
VAAVSTAVAVASGHCSTGHLTAIFQQFLKLISKNIKLDTYIKAKDFKKDFNIKIILDSRVS